MAERALAVLATLALTLAVIGSALGQDDEINGAGLFARYCASCHGPVGEGDGPVASVMAVAVPNLRTLRSRANGTFPRDAVVRYIDGRELPAAHGDRIMPVWGATFAEQADDVESGDEIARRRIAAITAFVEQLQN